MLFPTLSFIIRAYKSEFAIGAGRLTPLAAAFTIANIANLTKQPYIKLAGGIAAASIILFNRARFQEHYNDFSNLPLLGKKLTLIPAIGIGFIMPAVFNSFFQFVSPLGHINFLISTLALNMLFVPVAKDQHAEINKLLKALAVAQSEKQKTEKPTLQIQELANLLQTAKDELDKKDERIASLEETEQKYLQLMQQIATRRAQREAGVKKEE